jgi:gliding motility-associatede transport system auxiliary component
MMRSAKRFASLIAILGLVTLVVAVLLYVVNQTFSTPVQIVLSAGVVLLAVAAILRPDAIRVALSGRRTRYGSNALIMTVAFIGIVVLLNVLGNRYPQRFDLTENKDFSLSPQTIQILQGLKTPVHVIGFFTAGDPSRTDAEDLLKEYKVYSDKFTYEFVDPDVQRAFARQFQNPYSGSVFFTAGAKQQKAASIDEQSLTTALLKVTTDKPKVAYFIIGHGERDIQDTSNAGFSQIRQKMEDDNYQVATLTLATTSTVPSDASVLILASPQTELPQKELDTLSNYLQHGGRLVVLADPGLPDPLGSSLSAAYGFDLPNDFVVDVPNALLGSPLTPVITHYPYHRITEQLGNLATFFPLARPIVLTTNIPSTVTVTSLVQTSSGDDLGRPNSWADTGLKELSSSQPNVQFNPADGDIKGPINLAVAVENSDTKARLVVFGNSEFVSDNGLNMMGGQVGNADIFLNAVNWAAEEETLISVRSKPPTNRQIFLTGEQLRLVFLSTVVLLPLAVIAAGVAVWWRRR